MQNKYFTVFGIVHDDGGAAVEGVVRLGGDQERMNQSWEMDDSRPARHRQPGDRHASISLFVGPATMELVNKFTVTDLEGGIDLGIRWMIRPLSQAGALVA